MPLFRAVLTILLAGGLACAQPSSPPPAPTQGATSRPVPQRHLVVAISMEASGTQVIARRMVERPMQIDRAPSKDAWRVELTDVDGNVLHASSVQPVGIIRGEFEGPDGKLVHHQVRDPHPVLTVRVPVLPEVASLRVRDVSEVWDAQGKILPRDPPTVLELPWSEVAP